MSAYTGAVTVALDVEKAREWVTTECVISDDWDPREVGEESAVERLVRYAQKKPGIITGLEGGRIDFTHVPDQDQEAACDDYHFVVTLPGEPFLQLVGMHRRMVKLGAQDAVGVDAALAVLAEAVQVADNLTAVFQARVMAVLASTDVPPRPAQAT